MSPFKKLFLAGTSVFFLAACSNSNELGEESPFQENGVNTLEEIEMDMVEETYTAEGETFELVVQNNSNEEITYGVEFILEYNDDGTWYEVIPEEEIHFIMLAHILDAGEEATEAIDLSYYEPLEAGEYRLIREFEGEPLAANFEISEN